MVASLSCAELGTAQPQLGLSLLLLYSLFSLLLFVVVGQRNIEAVYVVLLEFDLKSYSSIGLFDFGI